MGRPWGSLMMLVLSTFAPQIPISGPCTDAEAWCFRTSATYSAVELRTIFNTYVANKKLQNAHEPQYIDVLESSPLHAALDNKKEPVGEHCRRDEALRRLQDNMQSWHSIDGVVRYVLYALCYRSVSVDMCVCVCYHLYTL